MTPPGTRQQAVGSPLAVVLSLLAVFGPISMDLYLPVLPALTAGGLLATAALHLPLVAVVLSLVTLVSGVAVTTPPTTSLALAGYPDVAGTASSFLGVARFAFGGLSAPLVGLGGSSAVPLGLVTVAGAALAAVAYAVTIRHHSPAPTDPALAAADASAPAATGRVTLEQPVH